MLLSRQTILEKLLAYFNFELTKFIRWWTRLLDKSWRQVNFTISLRTKRELGRHKTLQLYARDKYGYLIELQAPFFSRSTVKTYSRHGRLTSRLRIFGTALISRAQSTSATPTSGCVGRPMHCRPTNYASRMPLCCGWVPGLFYCKLNITTLLLV